MIPSDSLYLISLNAANRVESKGFGVLAARAFVARDWTVGVLCAAGVEIALLSERRTSISWHSPWI